MEPERLETLINAAVDGEASAADKAALSGAQADDAGLQKLDAAVRERHALLKAAFAPRREAAAALAERVIGSLPTAVPRPASRALSWLALLLAAAAGFLLAVILFRPWERQSRTASEVATGGPEAPQVVPVAYLTVATGPVDVAPPNQRLMFTCPTGGPIEPGADVCTGPQSRCELSTTDGSAVRLDRSTKVKFNEPRAISLEQGELWSCVSRGKEPFAVKSPQATVTSNDGKFDLQCKEDETLLRVAEGTAHVRAAGGEKTVSAGCQIVVRNGTPSDQQAIQNLIFTTRWLHDILALKGADNPELQERFQAMFAEIGAAKLGYLYEQEIRAMGDASVLPLVYFLKRSTHDADQARRVIAARLLADLAPPRTIPELIPLLSDENGQVRFFIAQALTRLTGETQGRTPEAWRSDPLPTCQPTYRDWQTWWQEKKNRYAGGNR
jgi:ferric-dicitrate binding protein FerR (iron transport regulator)